MEEKLISKSERLTVVDTKLEDIGKHLNKVVFQNMLIFLLAMIAVFSSNSIELLPDFFGLKPSQYLQLLPVAILYYFIQFGFISLRGLVLSSERDILILELIKENKSLSLNRIKNIFRLYSFLEVFYKTLIFNGFISKTYSEEKTKSYKLFSFFCIILINFGNNYFMVKFLILYYDKKNYPLAIFCLLALVITIIAYVDYFVKIKKLRGEYKLNALEVEK